MFDHVLNRTEQVVHTDRTSCRIMIDREGFTISHFSVSYEARHAF